MFAFLRGQIARKLADRVELDVNGVGYEVYTSTSILGRVHADQTVTFLTYCHIREEAFTIFGFLREEEKALFLTLLSVSGVGPKMALAVLSAMSPAEFGRAVRENDVTAFTKVGGVGKKTAQRLIVEMKSKQGQDAELDAILGEPERGEEDLPETDDVVAALCSLGCTLKEAQKAAAAARKQVGDDASDEDLVRAALRSMSKV